MKAVAANSAAPRFLNAEFAVRSSTVESGMEYQLKRVAWNLFATLTWASMRHGIMTRRAQVTRWMRYWSGVLTGDPYSMLYVVRWERGELGGRSHCHCLMGGLRLESMNLRTVFAVKNSWKHGMARVRLFSYRQGDGVNYILKDAVEADLDFSAANTYELRKFARADAVFLSRSTWRHLAQLSAVPMSENHPASHAI